MEFLTGLLIFGGFWFWAMSGIAFFIIMAFAENENNIGAFITLCIFILAMEYADAINFVDAIKADPWFFVKWTALYFVIGSVWSIIKWFSYVRNLASEFGKHKLKYLQRCNDSGQREINVDGDTITLPEFKIDISTPIPEELMQHFKRYLKSERGYIRSEYDDIIPSAANNKDRIVTWIVWWPTSLLWTLINDPIRKLAEKIYAGLQGVYSKITQQAFSKFNV